MISAQTWDMTTRIGATGLADSIVVGTAIALIACLLNLFLRKKSAAVRFAVLIAALAGTASLPLLRLMMAKPGDATSASSLLRVADSWAPWIFVLWAVGAGVGLLRVGFGIWSLRRLRRACRPLAAPSLQADIEDAVRQYCPSRSVEILVSDKVTVPAAIGFFKPAIVLPEWLLEELSADGLRHVVIHELSHLRRRDDWSNLLQQVVKAVFFFHPAVWWLESRISLEREMACDDIVLMRSENPRDYAECLAHIAERSFLRRSLAMAQTAVSRVRETSHRVARILRFDKASGTQSDRFSVALASVFALLCTAAVLDAPHMVSFDSVVAAPASASASTLNEPETAIPAVRTVNAKWQEPERSVEAPKQTLRRKVRRQILPPAVTPAFQPRILKASFTAEDGSFTRSIVVVVMQDSDQVAVWQITTWQYSPSQQVRSAPKTT